MMDFSGTAGSVTNKLLPTGNPVDTITTSAGPLQISIVDVSNPCVFVRAKDVGMKGGETPQEVNGNPKLLGLMEEIRAQACVMIGMAPDVATATAKSPAFPMVAYVSPAADYVDFTTGQTIRKDQDRFHFPHDVHAGSAQDVSGNRHGLHRSGGKNSRHDRERSDSPH